MKLPEKSSLLNNIRFFFSKIRKTPFHPQWHVFRDEDDMFKLIFNESQGLVIDIGCGQQAVRRFMPNDATYVGLDYYTTSKEWYQTSPDIYANAQALPFKDQCVDVILLLDVLEHLPDPERCIGEIARTLKKQGRCILQVPFMYPIHDAPLDFTRWTSSGLSHITEKHGLIIEKEYALGQPLECAALFLNIALSKLILNWIKSKNPLAVLILTLPVLIPSINIFSWFFSVLSPKDPIMPFGYRLICSKH